MRQMASQFPLADTVSENLQSNSVHILVVDYVTFCDNYLFVV